jgi:hypothetical protein
MDDEFSEGPIIAYDFFKAISAKDKSFLCDFYKVRYKNGIIQYKINLQALNHKEVIADMIYNDTSGWHLARKTDEISPEIEWKLTIAIIEQLNDEKK